MYREPAIPDGAPPAPELVYEAVRRNDGANASITIGLHVMGPFVVAAVGSTIGGPVLGAAALAAGAAVSVWSFRHSGRGDGALLQVSDGALRVTLRRGRASTRTLPLRELLNVMLDIKTIERVTEGNGAIPALRFVQPKIGPKVDTARILLVTASGDEIALTEEYLAHMDATEWLGRIRVFLRTHGWLPEDERESPDASVLDDP